MSSETDASARTTRAGRRHRCAACGSRNVARIAFGYPLPGWEEDPDFVAGEYVLGGCCVWPDMPEFRCNACGNEWRVSAVMSE